MCLQGYKFYPATGLYVTMIDLMDYRRQELKSHRYPQKVRGRMKLLLTIGQWFSFQAMLDFGGHWKNLIEVYFRRRLVEVFEERLANVLVVGVDPVQQFF